MSLLSGQVFLKLSQHVLFGLAMTRDAGYQIDSGVIERGAAWLKGRLGQMDRRTQAFAFYALALAREDTGTGDSEIRDSAQVLADLALTNGVELDPFSRAALAIALLELGDDVRAHELVTELTAEAKEMDDEAFWPTGLHDGAYRQKAMASTTRTTALVLDALVRVEPDHPLVPKAVRWLLGQRQGKSWGTTQETSFALLALADYVVASQEHVLRSPMEVCVRDEVADLLLEIRARVCGGDVGNENDVRA